jgi:hypothetical protein
MSSAPVLPHEKIQALSRALASAGVPHAFGGAIALLYCGEPRGTIDIDVNVFVHERNAAPVLGLLRPLGVAVEEVDALSAILRDGQVRLDWTGTPLDLFFAYDALHDACRERSERVDFLGMTISVLSAEDLVVFKVLFNRRKDWADVEQILRSQGPRFDAAYVRNWLARIVGDSDSRAIAFEAVVLETRDS